MSQVELFKNNPIIASDLMKELLATNDTLGGNSFGTTRRISLRGSKFRLIVNGEQIKISKHDTMNMVIVAAAKVGRNYYEGTYDPDVSAAPICWSNDTVVPSPDVKEQQCSTCGNCTQNIKGSGQGESRACRYSQRLAIILEGDMETVYQLQIPATSIFGSAEENKLPMQAYARFLQEHNTPAVAVITEMRFDDNSDVPKLFFSPVRALEEDELKAVLAMRDHEDTRNAITFKVFDTDKGKTIPADKGEAEKVPETKTKYVKKDKPAPATLSDDDEGEEVEPTRRESRKDETAPEERTEKMAKLLSQWDD